MLVERRSFLQQKKLPPGPLLQTELHFGDRRGGTVQQLKLRMRHPRPRIELKAALVDDEPLFRAFETLDDHDIRPLSDPKAQPRAHQRFAPVTVEDVQRAVEGAFAAQCDAFCAERF
jgi:hypothetical protein